MSSAIQHRYSHTLSPRLLQSTTNCWQAPEQTYLPVFSRAGTARNDHAAHLADIARCNGRKWALDAVTERTFNGRPVRLSRRSRQVSDGR